ncbi:hypothetical protein ABVT39_012215 [Epinephelus coioides]
MKNQLSDFRKFLVCPSNQAFILHILDKCIDHVSLPPGMRLMHYLLQLGQKNPQPLSVVELFHYPDHILAGSFHAACSVSSKDKEMDLMWSRHAINRLYGNRGSIYTNMSIRESANFQSNLNHHPMDVNPRLWQLFTPERGSPVPQLNFLQLYCDAPHRHQSPCFKHPVSGVIVMIEAVLRLEGVDVPDVVEARSLFHEERLLDLLKEKAMLVPFRNSGGQGLHTVVGAVVEHLVGTLDTLFTEAQLCGGYDEGWKAFQYELALEDFFHGQPRASGHAPFSVSLGTSSVHVNSRTRERGFLALAPWSSASAANDSVLGREVVRVLLKDVYDHNERLPIAKLQGTETKIRAKDSMEYSALAQKVVDNVSFFRYPKVFRRVNDLLVQKGRDTKKVLALGLASMGLCYFPALC